MPIPNPRKDQTKEEFIDMFMSDDLMNSEYPDKGKRYAIAIQTWESRNKAKTYNPPELARNNAKKALRWRKEYPKETKGAGTQVGWTRANQLASGQKLSLDTVKRMAQFNRHRKNSKVNPKYKDKPWRDKGYLMWLAWGGDTGIDWAKRIVESENTRKEDKTLANILKAKRLKDVKVKTISMLTDDVKPSNRQKVIVKSDNTFDLDFVIKSVDKIKGIVYATAMKANYEDTDGEYYTNEDVEKAAYEFMKAGISNRVDTNHNFETEEDVYIVESYIAKEEDGYEWKTAFDISENETYMQKAKEGKLTGVSISGTAKTIEEEPKEDKIGKLEVELDVKSNVDNEIESIKKLNIELEKTIELKKQLLELDKQEYSKPDKKKPKEEYEDDEDDMEDEEKKEPKEDKKKKPNMKKKISLLKR